MSIRGSDLIVTAIEILRTVRHHILAWLSEVSTGNHETEGVDYDLQT